MKNSKKFVLILVFTFLINSLNAQTINWASVKKEAKHILHANAGVEHGAVFGLGYGYQFKSRLFPMIANVEVSLPSGGKMFDDFKTKIGGQIRLLKHQNFHFSAKVHGVYRIYQNELVRLQNFGSDLSGILGYYRPKWFVAGEVGFDKAIITHFNHTKAYKDQYAAVDGWYEPATGGNLYYGLQAGLSFGNQDLTLRAGKMLRQDFQATPLIPFYGQIGYTIKF